LVATLDTPAALGGSSLHAIGGSGSGGDEGAACTGSSSSSTVGGGARRLADLELQCKPLEVAAMSCRKAGDIRTALTKYEDILKLQSKVLAATHWSAFFLCMHTFARIGALPVARKVALCTIQPSRAHCACWILVTADRAFLCWVALPKGWSSALSTSSLTCSLRERMAGRKHADSQSGRCKH
jgi:hypothetical protein